ncbi:MAG: alpha/beta hydrolase [Bacteroidota bacterium]
MKITLFNTFAACSLLTLASCGGNNTNETLTTTDSTVVAVPEYGSVDDIKPAGPAPAWGKDIKLQMQAVMEKLASYGDRPIPELTPEEARKNHTPSDAVMDLIAQYNIEMPAPKCDTMGKEIPVSGGSIHARIYTPKDKQGPLPVIVYYHGGGYVIADINVYSASAQQLCEQAGAVVVAVEYRHAPEHKFPTAHNDSFAAYKWVTENTASIGGDSSKIAVAGESAGGNLAVNMAIMARDKKIKTPVAILAVYPIAQADMNTESYKMNAAAKPLDKPMMEWFVKHTFKSMAEAKDPRISLVNANLKGLPPVTIITAQIDPLQSDGTMLADKLKAAGVDTDLKNYDGVTHEFFGMGIIVPQAKDAMEYAVGQLKKKF